MTDKKPIPEGPYFVWMHRMADKMLPIFAKADPAQVLAYVGAPNTDNDSLANLFAAAPELLAALHAVLDEDAVYSQLSLETRLLILSAVSKAVPS